MDVIGIPNPHQRMMLDDLERHRIIHLVSARGFDPRTVARVLDGMPSRKRLVHQQISKILTELGVSVPSPMVEKRAA
jgi:hypothetical protein